MFSQASVGIDIHANSIRIVYLKSSIAGVKLVDHGIYPMESGQDNEKTADQVGGVVKQFLDRNRISSAAFFLGIPREESILRYVELPRVVKENLRDSLRYELEKYVPFPSQELYFDYQIISEDPATEKLRVLLLMVKREYTAPYLLLEQVLGERLSGIEVSSTAIANFFSTLTDFRETDAYVLIYARDDLVEIALVKKGFLAHSRPMGRFQRTSDFPEQVSQKIQKATAAITDPAGPLKIVVCNMEEESDLLAYLKADEAFDVHVFDLSSTQAPSIDMIPAYGLALKGIRDLPTDVNLLPKKMRKRPSKAGYYLLFGLTGVFIFLVLAWIGGTIFDTRQYVTRLDHELSRLKTEVSHLEAINAESGRIEKRIDALNSLRKERMIVLDVIKELSERVPKSAWLLKFTYLGKDKQIQIEGWADSASELIPLLDDSPLFKDVGFLASITTSSAGKERFRIGFELEN